MYITYHKTTHFNVYEDLWLVPVVSVTSLLYSFEFEATKKNQKKRREMKKTNKILRTLYIHLFQLYYYIIKNNNKRNNNPALKFLRSQLTLITTHTTNVRHILIKFDFFLQFCCFVFGVRWWSPAFFVFKTSI